MTGDDTEELPEGWAKVQLIEVATLQRGYDLPVQDRSGGSIPVIGGNGEVGRHDVSAVKAPGVVTGRSGTIGKVEIVETDFWPLNTSLFVSDFHGNDYRFIAILLRFLDLKKYHAGTGVPTLNRNVVHEVDVLLPPLAEQRRIVAAVEGLLAAVSSARARLERVPATLKRFRQSVLTAMCSCNVGVETDHSSEWATASVKAILAEPLANGRSVPDADSAEESFPVLRLNAIRGAIVNLAERKRGRWTLAEASRFLVKRGDFLIVRGNGSLKLVGRGGLVVTDPDEVAYPDTLIRLRVDPTRCLPEYLRLVWDSETVRTQLEAVARTSAGIHKVSQPDIESVMVPLPPLAEQAEIVRRVSALFAHADALERRAGAALRRVEGLTQAVLAKAFRGELVPTEAELARREGRTYEPAADLLARIRAAAPATPKPRRGRKPTP